MWKLFVSESKDKSIKTEEDKLKVAYALNLCTVSVSQIIDYNDIRILEAEYESILNNLNLEAMPKDEALLRILKQLLDVITFFRIQEGDKKLMEKDYAQRMKDAIWSAVPNPSLIVANNSVSMAISLAAQVGIGYMNYRKEKAKISSDRERKEWELQRSAMEQFNGLKRELFDTAWRLADEYSFPDEYRITERQISQFDSILMDTDDLRRYERLDYIKDNFRAYPPFWYYLGHAANLVYLDESYENTLRGEYRNRAIAHFNYFLKNTEKNLLREDQIVASCALELFDITGEKSLLERAEKVSSNAFDVLQICAVSYLQIGETDKACKLLKMLVNEKYNESLNARLLSNLYIQKKEKEEYERLKHRVSEPRYLFPWSDAENSSERFIESQKENLLKDYSDGLIAYIKKSKKQYASICKMQGNITYEMADFTKKISVSVGKLQSDEYAAIKFLEKVREKVLEEKFKKILESGDKRNHEEGSVKFDEIFGDAFTEVANKIKSWIDKFKDMEDISLAESPLYRFIIDNSLDEDSLVVMDGYNDDGRILIEEVFDKEFKDNFTKSQLIDRVIEKVNECKDNLICDEDAKTEIIVRGEPKFKPYLERNQNTYRKDAVKDDEIFAVLNDKSFKDEDLIFTTSRVLLTGWTNVKSTASYNEICLNKNEELQIGNKGYKSKKVDMETLQSMISEIRQVIDGGEKNEESDSLESKIKGIMEDKTQNSENR